MSTAYLIVRYYPQSERSEMGIYSSKNLGFSGERPTNIVLDSASGTDFQSAKKKLIERLCETLLSDHQITTQLVKN